MHRFREECGLVYREKIRSSSGQLMLGQVILTDEVGTKSSNGLAVRTHDAGFAIHIICYLVSG